MRLLGYGEYGSTETVTRRYCVLNKTPSQNLYAEFIKDSTEGANDGEYLLKAGRSTGTFEVIIGEGFKSKTGSVIGKETFIFF